MTIESRELTKAFVLFRRAEWAYDRDTCLEIIEELKKHARSQKITKREHREVITNNSFDPQLALIGTAELIEDHLKYLSFSKFRDQFIQIRTNSLRATLYRLDEYEFFLRGYLLDLELESSFYEKTRLLASEYEINIDREYSDIKTTETKTPKWTRTMEDMRIKTNVGDFALFEMEGVWIGPSTAEKSREIIISQFQNALDELDLRVRIN